MGWLLILLVIGFGSPWVGMWSVFRWLGRHEDNIGELQRWVLSHHNLLPPHQKLVDVHEEIRPHWKAMR